MEKTFVFNHTSNQERSADDIKALKKLFPRKDLVLRKCPLPKIPETATQEEIELAAKELLKVLFINKGHAILFINVKDEYTRYVAAKARDMGIPQAKDGERKEGILKFYLFEKTKSNS